MANPSEISQNLVREIAERLARLQLYAEKSVRDQSNGVLVIQASRIRVNANRYFNHAYNTFHGTQTDDEKCTWLFKILRNLPYLEEAASLILPFHPVPPEAKRFIRFIERNILTEAPALEIHLTATKRGMRSSTVEAEEMINKIESLLIDSLSPNANTQAQTATSSDSPPPSSRSVPIELPAFDCCNPLKWPIILHEVGHHIHDLLDETFPQYFRNFLSLPEDLDLADHFQLDQVNVESWLEEIWCDCFAAYLLGPIIFFTQYQVFLRSQEGGGSLTHPSYGMRLYILETFLQHRHGRNFPSAEASSYLDTIFAFEKGTPLLLGENRRVTHLCNCITKCLLAYFPKPSLGSTPVASHYNEKLFGVISTTSKLDISIVHTLTSILNLGLPIPSLDGGTADKRATTLEEIFYAGWLSHSSQITKAISTDLSDSNQVLALCEASIRVTDERILSSVQVSEWVRGFISGLDIRIPDFGSAILETPERGILGFDALINAIRDTSLRVIPLIDGKSQIGRCSLDLRLGTSFELLSDSKNSIDFLTDDSKLDNFTLHHELDFGEAITISPGQFVIAHTMEYVLIPQHLCGQIDGRSSFARVGLMIHATAGFLEAGYSGSVTLEIYNIGTAPIILYPGYRVCQLRLMPVGAIPKEMFGTKRYERQYGYNRTRKFLDVELSVMNSIKGENL